METAKLSYLKNLGNKVNSPGTSQKSYWKIINRVMNKCRAPKIPPLLVNNLFILNCRGKARFFNDYFSQQCKPLINNSVLPIFRSLANKKINHVTIRNDDIVSLIRKINPNPNKQATEVLFSCKISNPSRPQIMFNGTVVSKMNEHKHLGLLLDSSLSFKKHPNEKIIKAKKNLGIIKHLSIYLPRKTLDQMYKALIRSHLDYCDIIYHIPSVQTQFGVTTTDLMEKAERIQYQVALAITGAWQGSSRSKVYEELGWESLSDRRWCRRILQIHKIVSNNTPSYLKDKLPRYRRPLYSQRNNNDNIFHEI